MIWQILIIIHILICIISYVLIKRKIVYTKSLILPMIVLIPIWGFVSFLMEEFIIRRNRKGTKEIGVDKLRLSDKKYSRIRVDNNDNREIIVPLEEAILINDAKTRRSLMLDILRKNPDEYVDMLQRTKLSADPELTHYATTTIMEIQGGYERRLQRSDARLKKNPEDEKELNHYLNLLVNYIDSGLLTGNILMIQRIQLKQVLEKLLKTNPYDKKLFLLNIENELEMGQLVGIEDLLNLAKKRWPEEEKLYVLYVNFYRQVGKGKEIKELLQEITENKIHLSREGKEWFEFWNKGRLNA